MRPCAAKSRVYDAYCPYGLVDVGVEEARRVGVKIPVVGQAEASALYCGLLGRKFASCSYVASARVMQAERMKKWGLEHLYVGQTAIGIPNSEYPSRRKEVMERFVKCCQEAKAKGAEIMGMIGMSICPTEYSPKEYMEASGFPVMDGMAAQIAMAEWWHRTGLPPSLLKLPR